MRKMAACFVCVLLAGCMNKLEEQTKSTGSIVGKTTQDIKERDPKSTAKVSDSVVRVEGLGGGGTQVYRPIIEQASKLQIEQAVNLFKAANDRYPKDHKEFMEEIVKENNIKLPVLPGKWEYQYDVANHKLEVVEKK